MEDYYEEPDERVCGSCGVGGCDCDYDDVCDYDDEIYD